MTHHAGLIRIIIIGIIVFSYAMFQGGFVSWFLFYATLPFLLFAMIIYLYPIKKLNVTRTFLDTDFTRGQTLDLSIALSREDRWPLYYVKVTDRHPFVMHEKKQRVLFLGFRREVTLTYQIESLPRGMYTFEAVDIELVDLLGWVRKSWTVGVPQQITVYPRVTDFMYVPIASNYEQGAALARYQVHKESTVVTGIREYQPGDRVSWIHWKSFAKNQTLRTKDFEDRQAQDTLIYLDRSTSDNFDDAVDFTLSVIQAMTKSESTGAFAVGGQNGLNMPVVTHQGHFERVRRYLATVEEVPNKQMLRILSEEKKLSNYKGILYIGTSLQKDCVEALTHAAPQVREGIYFIIKPDGSPRLTSAELHAETYLKARGWTTITLTPAQFTEAFGEVAKR